MTTTDVRAALLDLGIDVVAESRGRGGVNYVARCPHHYGGSRSDNKPSWSINAQTGLHHCFSCGFRGSLPWLIHKVTGIPLPEATEQSGAHEWAYRRVLDLDPWDGARQSVTVPMSEARIKMYDSEIPDWAMARRRLTAESARLYEVHWAAEFRHGRDGQTCYPNCWVIPIREPRTLHLMGIQVKQEGDRFFRNLPGGVNKGSTVFGVGTIPSGSSVVVVESPLDAVYLHGLGYSAVSTMGAHITEEQADLLIDISDSLVLAMDNDAAGRAAINQFLGLYPSGRRDRRGTDYSQRIPVRVVDYGDSSHKDPGDMGPDTVHRLLAESVSAFRWQTLRRPAT